MYKDLRDQNQVFEGMLAADKTGVGVSWRNQAEGEDAEVVTGNYFQMLGLKPAAGRLLTPQDDTAKNANPVLVLSYNYWKSTLCRSARYCGPDGSCQRPFLHHPRRSAGELRLGHRRVQARRLHSHQHG